MKQKMFPIKDTKLPMVHDLKEEACPSDHSHVQEQAPTQAQLQGHQSPQHTGDLDLEQLS